MQFKDGWLWFSTTGAIHKARDTNGDGKADETQVIAEDFGVVENPENSANGLIYNLDNWIYNADHDNRLRVRDGDAREHHGNRDDNAAQGRWTDAVYLSSDTAWDVGDILLGKVDHSGDVAGHSSYGGSLTAGLFLGYSRAAAARYSFLLAIPVVAGTQTLIGIAGHAFITTALLAASFVYSHDMTSWLQVDIEKLQQKNNPPARQAYEDSVYEQNHRHRPGNHQLGRCGDGGRRSRRHPQRRRWPDHALGRGIHQGR